MYPSPRALHTRLHTCTHVTLRRPTASHASQESTRMLRDVHMRECAHVPLPRALRPRAIISTRACMWCYRCRHCRPQFPTALDQNARFGQDRDQELRAGPRKSEPSSSPARRAQAHASPARAVSSMPCIDTTVYGGISCKVACTYCVAHACATSCIIERDITDCVTSLYRGVTSQPSRSHKNHRDLMYSMTSRGQPRSRGPLRARGPPAISRSSARS